jgi:threonylcarbamoyladenosine tRNA methylthiotransferase MtaB
MKKIAISTLGCKVNQYESAAFQSGFEAAGCRMVKAGEDADIIVINTCTVTARAGAQSRHVIRQLMRRHPGARIIVTGCYAQMAGEELRELFNTPVCVIGNAHKEQLVQTALGVGPCDATMLMTPISQKKEICHLPVRHFGGRTRACLRVQDGCNNFCTYCIVPHTRGPSRSLPLEKILEQAAIFEAEGHREMVVTGIHVGLYGQDLDPAVQKKTDCTELMRILCRTHPDIRFRLSSIEPTEISHELLSLMAEQHNFLPHLHIPLQSGDDTILRRMGRGYSSREFRDTISLCRRTVPDAAIGIDVLVGFPGETEAHFAGTLSLLEECDCTSLHVFPYSQRPGTPAASFDQQVPQAVKDHRAARLKQLDAEKKERFYQRYLDTSRPVLVEHKRDLEGNLRGFTDNYIPLSFPGSSTLMNTIATVTITGISAGQVRGTSAEENHAG